MEAKNSTPHQVLEIDGYERMLSDGSLTPDAPVTITMPAEEYRRRQEEGTLPNKPIMQRYDLRPYLERYRRIEEEIRRREWERSICGRVSGVVRSKFRQLFS